MEEAERKGIVAYLGHDPELFHDSVRDNVLLGDEKDLKTYLKAVCIDREVSDMEEGEDTLIGNGGVRLSGGQAQRVALARTLCHKKPLLVLDDPFSALDKSTEKEVFANVRAMTRDSIVLLLSHRLYLFPQMDQIIWMDDGKTTVGTHEELLQKVSAYAGIIYHTGRRGQSMKHKGNVRNILIDTVKKQKWLSSGILIAVLGAIGASLIPPLLLGKIVDSITEGHAVAFSFFVLYFVVLALTGFMDTARESLLTVFGQKITHALRSRLMEKFVSLSADTINQQEPGTMVSRFIGDVDTVENLFTSGIISMFADTCKILSILAVIWFRNKGLTLVLLFLLPFLFWFTRHVQKNMLTAQIENRRAVGRASGHVPETLHNIRTIHCFGKEKYMEERYDKYISDSYRAMERTNFYDAIYSPVILILNAVVVAVVMLLSASGNQQILTFFGMSAGTAVAVINYISQIFTPVESFGMEIQTIQSAMAGIHRINEFFNLEAAEADRANGKRQGVRKTAKDIIEQKKQVTTDKIHTADAGDQTAVSFENVVFGYDEHLILEGVSLR